MKKIMMLDGHSLIHRAFYGMPDFTNAEGKHTGAVYGFLSILLMLLEQQRPDALLVAFDVHAPTFRHDLYEEYKGTRKPMLPELREQIPLMKEVLGAMDIPIIEEQGIEADDVLGSLSVAFAGKGYEVVVVSGDRDLLQLADEHVTICIPKTKKGQTVYEFYGPKEVEELYHVTPRQFIDVKALMGDASDNIPGLPGVGEKTAVAIIETYGSIEDAYAHIDAIKPPRAQKAFKEHYDIAQLSKILATIKLDAEIGEPDALFAEAKLNDTDAEDPLRAFDTQRLESLFRELNFKKYLTRLKSSQPGRATAARQAVTEIVEAGSAEEVQKFINSMKEKAVVGLAIVHQSEEGPLIALMQRSFSGIVMATEDEACYAKTGGELSAEDLSSLIGGMTERGHQISVFDLKKMLKDIDLEQNGSYFDPSIAQYLINPLLGSYEAEDLSSLVDRQAPPDRGDAVAYAAWQARIAALMVPYQQEQLEERQMTALMQDMEMPLTFTLDRMEKTGILIDKAALERYGSRLKERIETIRQKIYDEAGEVFNINSPKQLGEILFEKMGMPHGKKTKTGYSTSAQVLDKLAEDYPFVREILEYRQLTKLSSTYAEGLVRFIEDDGRIHGTFNQTVTATGRISSTEPNLQNIPIRVELGRLIRKVFVPCDGCVFVDADYSQVELRILAHMSGDEKLIDAYRQAQDIHRATAASVFHVPIDQVTEQQRRNAKAVNFGIVYGISSFGLSEGLSISRAQAKEYIDHYFETFPGIKRFLDGAVESAKQNGYAVTMFGRRRPVPELTASNYMQRQFGERVAMNAPIQGSAADIMKIAMIRAEKAFSQAGLAARIVVQVHDELLVETPAEEVETVRALLSDAMEHAAEMAVDLKVDIGTGADWYEAH